MRTFTGTRVILGTVLVILGLLAVGGYAQTRRSGPATTGRAGAEEAEAVILRIRKVTGLGSRSLFSTPYYDTNFAAGTKPARKWAMMRVDYDTAPEWIDELTFRYTVMTLKMVQNRKQYSLYKGTVKYMDIAGGRGHVSTMLLRPTAIERHGSVIGVAVEILNEGEVIASDSDQDDNYLPAQWWRDPRVTEAESVTLRAGYLLDRSKTPFAFVNYDDYEAIK